MQIKDEMDEAITMLIDKNRDQFFIIDLQFVIDIESMQKNIYNIGIYVTLGL